MRRKRARLDHKYLGKLYANRGALYQPLSWVSQWKPAQTVPNRQQRLRATAHTALANAFAFFMIGRQNLTDEENPIHPLLCHDRFRW